MLITFEGCEGCGKSTQASLLYSRLIDYGRRCTLLREPGSTTVGLEIRKLLLSRAMGALCEVFLFSAARAQLVQDKLAPAYKAGGIILCDRFTDSTLAYQGYGRGLALHDLRYINAIATGGITPHITILLDIDPEVGLKRKASQGEWNRIDDEEMAFHQRVRAGYLEMVTCNPERWFVVDASLPVDDIGSAIWQRVLSQPSLSI